MNKLFQSFKSSPRYSIKWNNYFEIYSKILKKFVNKKDEGDNISNKTQNQLKSTNQIKTSPLKNLINHNEKDKIEIISFQDLIKTGVVVLLSCLLYQVELHARECR